MFGEAAPLYSKIIEFFYNLDETDTVIVIGTAFEVMPCKWVAGPVKNGTPPFRILCNLDKSYSIDSWAFDKVIYGKATEHINEIVNIVEERLSKNQKGN